MPRWRRIEFASLLVAYLLALIELGLFVLISGAALSLPGLLLRALVQILDWLVWIELIAILVRCILSFVVSARYEPEHATADAVHRAGRAPVPAPAAAAGRPGFFLLVRVDRPDPRADAGARAIGRSGAQA